MKFKANAGTKVNQLRCDSSSISDICESAILSTALQIIVILYIYIYELFVCAHVCAQTLIAISNYVDVRFAQYTKLT